MSEIFDEDVLQKGPEKLTINSIDLSRLSPGSIEKRSKLPANIMAKVTALLFGTTLFLTACGSVSTPPKVEASQTATSTISEVTSTPTPTATGTPEPLPTLPSNQDPIQATIEAFYATVSAETQATATTRGPEGLEEALNELPVQYVHSTGILEVRFTSGYGERGSALIIGPDRDNFYIIVTAGHPLEHNGEKITGFDFIQPHLTEKRDFGSWDFGLYNDFPDGRDIALIVFTAEDVIGGLPQYIGYGSDSSIFAPNWTPDGEKVGFLGFPGFLDNDPFPAFGFVDHEDEYKYAIETTSAPGSSGASALNKQGKVFAICTAGNTEKNMETGQESTFIYCEKIPRDIQDWIDLAKTNYYAQKTK